VLSDQYTTFVGADNRKIGHAAGAWVRQRIADLPRVKSGGRAQVVELEGLMTSTPAQDRHAGFRAALEVRSHSICSPAKCTYWPAKTGPAKAP